MQIKLLMNSSLKSLESLRERYQGNSETSMRESNFIFDSAQMMHCRCHKVNFRQGGSYIDSPDWIKKKRSKNYFQYAATVALNYKEIN